MATGPRDTTSLVLLTGWDATALQNFQLEDGTTSAAVAANLNAALGALNAELVSDPLWASLCSYTDQLTTEYRVGVSTGFAQHTEYGRPDEQRSELAGHMLPIQSWDRALGWTWDYLRKARLPQIEADVADALKDARDLWRQKLLTRLLTRGDDSGSAKGLGTTGYSPGFATAAASTSVDFTPPAFGGTSFDSNHEHYYALAGGAYTAAVFTDAFNELREHGHEPPFQFIISPSDRSTVLALSDFVKAPSTLVNYGSATTVAAAQGNLGGWGTYLGTIEECLVYEVRGLPQYWGFAWKSYGANSQRNPLRVRVPKGARYPQVVAMQDPRNGSMTHPLQYMMLFTEFGVGVGDRTNGSPRYVNNASWADGTPT